MADPAFLQPFVITHASVPRERIGAMDIYRPAASSDELLPAIVFIHGGPVPPDLLPTPRDWPVYIGYGSLATASGVVGVTVDHRLHSVAHYPAAADDVIAAVDQVRALPGVDPQGIALWFFSGGGLLSADWLREPPEWLRCVALTYPLLAPVGPTADRDINDRFNPAEAVSASGKLPILLHGLAGSARMLKPQSMPS
ncbi:acetyl esterase/lipase [Arthrobacter pigmenti]|uniref:Acetyl esterase/lipase n=1 Tax=Arthrobacter pigmenti TaxID=271432 RepID=A0A846RR68_9MICC|nr:alpha/beta hydrolase fold domain-containing protein [Arthrobacter pigmenti]NJC22657.1 acetyl esterase/lipase [Arthrobacter pigmenti]